jgi:hypothetical protein
LIGDGCYGVTPYQPTTDKIMRLHCQAAVIENGFVHLPETAPWLAGYLHQMTVFPGKHDDQVDSTAQFLDWLKTLMPCWGIFEHTGERRKELKPTAPVFVRVKPFDAPLDMTTRDCCKAPRRRCGQTSRRLICSPRPPGPSVHRCAVFRTQAMISLSTGSEAGVG